MIVWLMIFVFGAHAQQPSQQTAIGSSTSVFDALFVLSFRSSVLEPFKIPSGSMYPTLHIGDQIWVRKWAYRVNVPLTRVALTKSQLPNRGDVIVFAHPTSSPGGFSDTFDLPIPGLTTVDYIKRVIGLPGDNIAVKDGVVYLNGQPLPQTRQKTVSFTNSSCRKSGDVTAYTEMVGDKTYSIYREDTTVNDFAQTTVPPNMLFVLGDNRDYSADSRAWGFVPVENLKGKAISVYFSVDVCSGQPRSNRSGLFIE